MFGPTIRENDGLERSVHSFLHGRCPKHAGRFIEQIVVDVYQALTHSLRISKRCLRGYTASAC